MKGIHYKHANTVLLGGRPDVYDLPICRFQYSDGQNAVESCWKMTFRERLKVMFSGKVYFQCFGITHPPILLSAISAMEERRSSRVKLNLFTFSKERAKTFRSFTRWFLLESFYGIVIGWILVIAAIKFL
jgi:hypothetical protein